MPPILDVRQERKGIYMSTENPMTTTTLNLELEQLSFMQSLQLILDPQDLHINDSDSAKAEINTLSIKKSVLGVAYPRTIEQLQHIVRSANKHKVAIYPVSQGKNIGYGDMTPTGSDQLVIGLKYLNSIREFDADNGEVVVEPGVSQGQLAEYLNLNKAKYWADSTGASPDASLIGNTLEAGFGHTPIGDHRKHILQMEVMLADGTIMTTAEMPAIGPDLAQLFVQSNFAIVISMRIPLFPIPEETLTFVISFDSDRKFFDGIKILTALRKDGTIASLAHTGNSTRALMTSTRFPKDQDRNSVLTEENCRQILNEKSPLHFGAWSTVGGLYGYRDDVKNKQKRLMKALKGKATVKFFTDNKINTIDKLLNSKWALKFSSLDLVRGSFASLKGLHGIIRGQPSNHPSQNIFWRIDSFEKLGLMWHAPVIPATGEDCAALLETCRVIYAKHKFEMPVTLTLIDHKHMTGVFNISFDKSNAEETARAHKAYQELSEATFQLGYLPYRCGLASKAVKNYSPEQFAFLQKIKLALDPQNILAPGRYGICQNVEN